MTDIPSAPPSDDLVKRFHGEEWSVLPDRVRVHIRAIEAQNTRLRAELAEMERCKNTCATLAYERDQEIFELRTELAEAKRTITTLTKDVETGFEDRDYWQHRAEQAEAARDRFAAVIWLLVKHPHDSPVPEFKSAGEYCDAIAEALAHHHAKEEEKNRG